MKRGERRRAERQARKAGDGQMQTSPSPNGRGDNTIVLKNPVSDQFPAFIFGNSVVCQRVPDPHETGGCANDYSPECSRVAENNEAVGQHLVLCGAGPSLAMHAKDWCHKADQVWGCNSAATWLYDEGFPVTHGFTVDQTPQMVAEWADAPPLEYMLATSVHPHLTDWLIKHERRTTFFHNYVGVKGDPVEYEGRVMSYEDWMYSALYPPTIRAGSGLNSVNRALDVALFMGFDPITILGADCCMQVNTPNPEAPFGSPEHLRWLREDVVMHADGGHALASGATAITLGAEIDGVHWETKPDMVVSAVWLVKAARYHEGRVRIIGDTLPNALMDKPQEFLDRLPSITGPDGKPVEIDMEPERWAIRGV